MSFSDLWTTDAHFTTLHATHLHCNCCILRQLMATDSSSQKMSKLLLTSETWVTVPLSPTQTFSHALQCRDVKRSSKISISNKTFEFELVFWPFDIHLLTALCQMPQFIFDHACVDVCQHWLQTCNKSVDHWLASGLWHQNDLTSNCTDYLVSISSKA